LDIDDCEIEVLGVLPTKLEYLDLKGVKKLSYLYVHGDGGGARTTIRNLHTCGDLTNLILYGVNAGIVSLPECPLLKQLHITHCAAESIMLGQSSNLYDINVMCNHLSASNILSLLNHWNPRSNHQPHDMFLAWGNPGWPNAKATVSAQTLAKVGVAGQTCNCPCLEDGTER
jgi:hypothetical protein